MDSRQRRAFNNRHNPPDHGVETKPKLRGPYFNQSLTYDPWLEQISATFGPPSVYVTWSMVRNGQIVNSGKTMSGQVSFQISGPGLYQLGISYNGQSVFSMCSV